MGAVIASPINSAPNNTANTGLRKVTVIARVGPTDLIRRKYRANAMAVQKTPSEHAAAQATAYGDSEGHQIIVIGASTRDATLMLPAEIAVELTPASCFRTRTAARP